MTNRGKAIVAIKELFGDATIVSPRQIVDSLDLLGLLKPDPKPREWLRCERCGRTFTRETNPCSCPRQDGEYKTAIVREVLGEEG